MPLKMNRGKNQVMYSYLPGYTFDFDKSSAIAQIESIRGIQRTDLNLPLILQAVRNQAAAWGDLARIFADPRPDQFVLLEPKKVYAQLFPKVFWCQNRQCGQVFDYSRSDAIPKQASCPTCKRGRLAQLRFVKIHQCGDIKPLTPPYECNNCKTRNQFALDTRGSERISQFVWVCRKCGHHSSLFAGYCSACNWEVESGDADRQKKQMSIEVHRANRVFYPHYAVLLNQPGAEVNSFLGIDKWPVVAGGFFMELPELASKTVKKFVADQRQPATSIFTLSDAEIAQLKAMGQTDEQIEQFRQMQAQLAGIREQQQTSLSPVRIGQSLTQQTGVPERVWLAAGQELLEAVLPFQSNQTQNLFTLPKPNNEQLKAQGLVSQLGLAQLSLASDFPMTHITFGYSRAEYTPRNCRLNPFPADREHQGKFPLFVDTIQADAIILRLDPQRVWRWLEKNNLKVGLPKGATDAQKAQRAHFVQLFSDLSDPNIQVEPATLTQTLTANHAEARMVFGLLHTMSHLFVKKAALLCGLDRTSLAEYILPRALMFAIYSNHRFGATIGALSSLFEQSLPDWLGQVMGDTRRCIYDPVCQSQGGNCHACTHLAETSCRFFNLNLGRPFLFGGYDAELGQIDYGYWDTALNQSGNQ
jgi:hypothetical protein